ncbi:exodeoxyribonuclease VII small subunit [Gulosibacter bifidus]|uniref:Exodeoxyribonuclease 7 small subunit n=1 Tax=Gulosibacter bifidus TaxID=272239 RepID=A0ABW5RGR1_9MICO|nr:exodeoxyribonuclease VII small subunit [Gulosibacter bifidus]
MSANESTSAAVSETPVADLSFEAARDELALVVQQLEQGELPLEDSLKLWERGEALAARCEEWLKGARERLEQAREQRVDEAQA